jgi:hypothetical protein
MSLNESAAKLDV